MKYWSLVILSLLLSGCMTPPAPRTQSLQEVEALIALLQEKQPPNRDALVYDLNLARLQFAAGQFDENRNRLQNARRLISEADRRAERSVSGTAVEWLLNPKLRAYEAKTADRILLPIYASLNFVMLGDLQAARVEARAAAQAQQQVVNLRRAQLARFEEKLREAEKSGSSINMGAVTPDGILGFLTQNAGFQENYSALESVSGQSMDLSFDPSGMLAKADYETSVSHYLQGLIQLIAAESGGDLERASKSFEFAQAMAPANPFVQEDLQVAKARGQVARALPPRVWVIQENGLGPEFKEFKVTFKFQQPGMQMNAWASFSDALQAGDKNNELIRLPFQNPWFDTLVLAFPVMTFQPIEQACGPLAISSADGLNLRTESLFSVDQLAAREFREELPGILKGAVVGGIVKAFLISESIRQSGEDPSTIAPLLAQAITRADTRNWKYLPKEYRIASFDAPADGKFTLSAAAGPMALNPYVIDVPSDAPSIVYVFSPTRDSDPRIHVLPFEPRPRGGYEAGDPVLMNAPKPIAPAMGSEVAALND